MLCPKCGGTLKNIDTRHNVVQQDETFRCKRCLNPDCGELLFTVEYPVIENSKFMSEWKRSCRNKKVKEE